MHYLPSFRAIGDHGLKDLSVALADVDVVKNVSGANFAYCLRMKAVWVVRNGAAARWCDE